MLLDDSLSQLVLIDYQPKLMPVIFEGDQVLRNGFVLAQAAAALDVPIFGTEQNPSKLGELDGPIRALCNRVLAKMHFSACEEGLSEWLRPPARQQQGNARSLPKHLQKAVPQAPAGRDAIVVAGVEAHICMMQTALDLLEDEFDVWVVTDACSSRTEKSRDAAFDRLAGAGAELVTTEMVLFEWLKSAEHPQFKELQALIK